jgi:hypothetical protein
MKDKTKKKIFFDLELGKDFLGHKNDEPEQMESLINHGSLK